MAWTANEDQALLNQFEAGMSVEQIAQLHQRNAGAIQSRLKKISPK